MATTITTMAIMTTDMAMIMGTPMAWAVTIIMRPRISAGPSPSA